MIIDKHKTIFVHIPKNAGTSIKAFFESKEFYNQHKTIEQIKDENIEAYNGILVFLSRKSYGNRTKPWRP
mgnify:CR=1 FL=1